jgi:hypothetical protein
MAKLRGEDGSDRLLLRQREFFYGKSWNPVTESFKKVQGASDGSIDQWINILDEVAKAEVLPGSFLPALKTFLINADTIRVAPLISAWSKVCDVPQDFQARDLVDVRTAMRCVNSFRNRFAHVPFPHDPLEDIASSLEIATEQLFSVPPIPSSHEKEGASSPLTGAFRTGQCFLHGSQLESLPQSDPSADLKFIFPCKKKGEAEEWSGSVLVHIDSMVRPHILTRVKGLDVCEYTRFRAEANAILVLSKAKLSSCIPEPDKSSYVSESPGLDDESTSKPKENTLADALEAIRNGDFDVGIEFFSGLVRDRADYHIAWLRLGHAKREKAARLAPTDSIAALEMLEESLSDLKKAAEHVDASYKALAHYERSKTAYRITQVEGGDGSNMELALKEATEACKLSTERKYQTWHEYLNGKGGSMSGDSE